VRARYAAGWSSTALYTVNVDATAPEPFDVTVEQRNSSDANPKFVFAATDITSGVEKYELRLDEGAFAAAISPQQVMNVSRGEHTVTVRATDKAGNVREATAVFSISKVPSLNVVYDNLLAKTGADSELKLTILIGETLRLRGYAKINETIHVVIHSEETVFDFPVADHIDPAPVEPAPPGYEAWKLDIPLNIPAGDHEIFVSTLDEQGNVTAEAAVVKFRVVKNSVRIFNTYVSIVTVIKVLLIAVAVLFLIALLFIILYIRLRRRIPKQGRYF
jgi:hypothetical protein